MDNMEKKIQEYFDKVQLSGQSKQKLLALELPEKTAGKKRYPLWPWAAAACLALAVAVLLWVGRGRDADQPASVHLAGREPAQTQEQTDRPTRPGNDRLPGREDASAGGQTESTAPAVPPESSHANQWGGVGSAEPSAPLPTQPEQTEPWIPTEEKDPDATTATEPVPETTEPDIPTGLPLAATVISVDSKQAELQVENLLTGELVTVVLPVVDDALPGEAVAEQTCQVFDYLVHIAVYARADGSYEAVLVPA